MMFRIFRVDQNIINEDHYEFVKFLHQDRVHEIYCHTLKYLILGCEYLLQYVHLSIGFFENFIDFSGNYSIYPRARSIYFIIWKALKLFFMKSKYSVWILRILKLPPEFSLGIFGILPDIVFVV
jgi:hypothetical protein